MESGPLDAVVALALLWKIWTFLKRVILDFCRTMKKNQFDVNSRGQKTWTLLDYSLFCGEMIAKILPVKKRTAFAMPPFILWNVNSTLSLIISTVVKRGIWIKNKPLAFLTCVMMGQQWGSMHQLNCAMV